MRRAVFRTSPKSTLWGAFVFAGNKEDSINMEAKIFILKIGRKLKWATGQGKWAKNLGLLESYLVLPVAIM